MCNGPPMSAAQGTYGPPAAVSCLCRYTPVRCSVVGPFLWLARRPGTRYQTTFEIRRVLLTVFVVTWKPLFSCSSSVHSALGASRLCTIQIYYRHWIPGNVGVHCFLNYVVYLLLYCAVIILRVMIMKNRSIWGVGCDVGHFPARLTLLILRSKNMFFKMFNSIF